MSDQGWDSRDDDNDDEDRADEYFDDGGGPDVDDVMCFECGRPTGDRIGICDECAMFGPPAPHFEPPTLFGRLGPALVAAIMHAAATAPARAKLEAFNARLR